MKKFALFLLICLFACSVQAQKPHSKTPPPPQMLGNLGLAFSPLLGQGLSVDCTVSGNLIQGGFLIGEITPSNPAYFRTRWMEAKLGYKPFPGFAVSIHGTFRADDASDVRSNRGAAYAGVGASYFRAFGSKAVCYAQGNASYQRRFTGFQFATDPLHWQQVAASFEVGVKFFSIGDTGGMYAFTTVQTVNPFGLDKAGFFGVGLKTVVYEKKINP